MQLLRIYDSNSYIKVIQARSRSQEPKSVSLCVLFVGGLPSMKGNLVNCQFYHSGTYSYQQL